MSPEAKIKKLKKMFAYFDREQRKRIEEIRASQGPLSLEDFAHEVLEASRKNMRRCLGFIERVRGLFFE